MSNRIADPTFGVHPQARAILALLDREPAFAEYSEGYYNIDIDTSPWYNGREKGYVLVMSKIGHSERLVVTFGEHRNSDGIFVDSWKMGPLMNPPTVRDFPDEAYKTRKFFKATETAKAADFIYDLLEKHYNEWVKEEDRKQAAV